MDWIGACSGARAGALVVGGMRGCWFGTLRASCLEAEEVATIGSRRCTSYKPVSPRLNHLKPQVITIYYDLEIDFISMEARDAIQYRRGGKVHQYKYEEQLCSKPGKAMVVQLRTESVR